MSNCGYCYGKGCENCDGAIKAGNQLAHQNQSLNEKAVWRTYVVAFMSKGLSLAEAFTKADEAVVAEALYFRMVK